MENRPEKIVIEEYLSEQNTSAQAALKTIIICIFKAVHAATALIDINMPASALVEGGKRDQHL